MNGVVSNLTFDNFMIFVPFEFTSSCTKLTWLFKTQCQMRLLVFDDALIVIFIFVSIGDVVVFCCGKVTLQANDSKDELIMKTI